MRFGNVPNRSKLEERERQLRQGLGGVDLIGELDLTEDETDELAGLIRGIIKSNRISLANQLIEISYPCTFVTFVVFQGGRGYDEGDFWTSICSAAGLRHSPNNTSRWGKMFERIVQTLGKGHQFGGRRYVDAILGQGGIPLLSLPEFFEYMLQPSLTKAEWLGLNPSELIRAWIDGSSRYSVDKPVLRFLEFGGQFAESMVDRLQSLAREYADSGEMPSSEEVDLPPSIIFAYEKWITAPGQHDPKRPGTSRLRRPQIYLDPWGMGVTLHLPEQPVLAAEVQEEIWWQITDTDGEETQVGVRFRRIGSELRTESNVLPLNHPSAELIASLFVGEEKKKEWRLGLANPDIPALFFNPDTGAVIATNRRWLPAVQLWVLYDDTVRLECEPENALRITEELPGLPWQWSKWRAQEVDLTHVTKLKWTATDTEYINWVQEGRNTAEPRLVGGTKASFCDNTNVPLFIGIPPNLRVISSSEAAILRKWRIHLINQGDAEPRLDIAKTFFELQHELRLEEGVVELPLSAPELLGEAPVGQYRLHLQGPLGHSSDLRLRVAPHLFVTGSEDIVFPHQESETFKFPLLVETGISGELSLLSIEDRCSLYELERNSSKRVYQVDVLSGQTEANLLLNHLLDDDRLIEMALRIPVRRLRWLTILNERQLVKPEWRESHDVINLAALEQSDYPVLLVDFPASDHDSYNIWLRVIDIDRNILWEQEAAYDTKSRRFHRFDLRLIVETLRHSASVLCRVELVVDDTTSSNWHHFPMLIVRKELVLSDASITLHLEGNACGLEIIWRTQYRLKNRRIRLWPQTYPWLQTIGIAIPDDVESEYYHPLDKGALLTGTYLAEFTIRDPWLPELASEPAPDALNVRTLTLGERHQQQSELEERIGQSDATFETYCRYLFLSDELGDDDAIMQGLQGCFRLIDQATLEHLIAILERFPNKPTARAMQIKFYQADRIVRILERHERREIDDQTLRLYLGNVPEQAWHSDDICRVLLSVPNDQTRIRAAAELIAKGISEGFLAVLEWTELRQLTIRDAAEMLDSNPEKSLHILQGSEPTATVVEVWEYLALIQPNKISLPRIRVGYWVQSQAGWGRIEAIKNETGQSFENFDYSTHGDGYILHVTLRPGEDDERILLCLDHRTITFTRKSELLLCTTCKCCIARDSNSLDWHDKQAHPGQNLSFRQIRSPHSQNKPFKYQILPPDNIWAA